MKPTLLVLAAGMGSRYGGLKQMDGLGPNGETIIDYSIYDAVEAGFGKVVYIVRDYFKDQMIEAVNAKADRERYYAALREKAQSRADKFIAKANKNERFKQLTTELSKMEIALAKAEVFEPKNLPALTEQKAALLRERRSILEGLGIDEAQLLPQFTCAKCSDTGFLPSGVACNCYKPN